MSGGMHKKEHLRRLLAGRAPRAVVVGKQKIEGFFWIFRYSSCELIGMGCLELDAKQVVVLLIFFPSSVFEPFLNLFRFVRSGVMAHSMTSPSDPTYGAYATA